MSGTNNNNKSRGESFRSMVKSFWDQSIHTSDDHQPFHQVVKAKMISSKPGTDGDDSGKPTPFREHIVKAEKTNIKHNPDTVRSGKSIVNDCLKSLIFNK